MLQYTFFTVKPFAFIAIILALFFPSCQTNTIETHNEIDSLIRQAQLLELSAIDRTHALADSILKKSEELDYERGTAYAYLLKAKYLRQQMKINKTINTLVKAENLFKKIGDAEGAALTYNEILMSLRFTNTAKLQNIQLPDTCLLDTLITYEYYTHLLPFASVLNSPKFIKTKVEENKTAMINKLTLLQKQLDSGTYNHFIATHTLAKLNYSKGEGASKDSALKYYQTAAYYDLLLKNRQAWSLFTIAENFLKRDSVNLDSSRYYVAQSIELLTGKPIEKTDSLIAVEELLDTLSNTTDSSLYAYHLIRISYVLTLQAIHEQKKDLTLGYTNLNNSLTKGIDIKSPLYTYQINNQEKRETEKRVVIAYSIIAMLIISILTFFFVYYRLKTKLLSLVAKHTENIVIIMDKKANLLYANKAFNSFYGKFDQYRRKNLTDISKNNKIQTLIEKCKNGEKTTYITQIGEKWLQTNLVAIRKNDKISKLVAIETDITEFKQIQDSLIESEKLEQLSYVVRGISHEINTPIATITGLVEETQKYFSILGEQLKSLHADNKTIERLKSEANDIGIILRNAKQVGTLIRSYHNIAKDELKGEEVVFNLLEKVNDIIQVNIPRIKQTNIDIVSDIENVEILSYPGAISQILMNFILNSIKHGFPNKEQGEIVIKAVVKEKELYIEYKDTGKGISAENVSKIFDLFYTTNPANSSGLGLSIVKLIIDKIEGEISCTSEADNGVLFIVKIPLNKV